MRKFYLYCWSLFAKKQQHLISILFYIQQRKKVTKNIFLRKSYRKTRSFLMWKKSFQLLPAKKKEGDKISLWMSRKGAKVLDFLRTLSKLFSSGHRKSLFFWQIKWVLKPRENWIFILKRMKNLHCFAVFRDKIGNLEGGEKGVMT